MSADWLKVRDAMNAQDRVIALVSHAKQRVDAAIALKADLVIEGAKTSTSTDKGNVALSIQAVSMNLPVREEKMRSAFEPISKLPRYQPPKQ